MTSVVALVSGGAGFLGSHLCERLIERGNRVICIDDLSTGDSANLSALKDQSAFELRIGDVCQIDPASVERVDLVFHLASPASPPAYLARPFATLDVGSIGTRRLLEIAARDRARFVLASTSEVYGDPLVHPQTESYWGNVNPVGERAVYDEAKRFAEAMTAAAHRTWGLDVGIARIFNTYGPRLQPGDGRVVSNFITQALRSEPLTVYGDGSQTRSFCFVDDLINGLIALSSSTETMPINLGNPYEISVLDLTAVIAEVTGMPVRIQYQELPTDDPRVRCPDVSRASSILGWSPAVDLETGLRATAEWFRSVANR
jgi:nucleoside-diphosphate-sugar epimerase